MKEIALSRIEKLISNIKSSLELLTGLINSSNVLSVISSSTLVDSIDRILNYYMFLFSYIKIKIKKDKISSALITDYLISLNYDNIISPSVDIKTKQLACALYLIDNLALRVGNEKGEDEADTVGVCSLRVEHIEFLEGSKIKLDFLGKDSVRYTNIVKIDESVYKTLLSFIKNKKKKPERIS